MVKKTGSTAQKSAKEASSKTLRNVMMGVLVTLMLTTAVILVIAKFNNVNVFDAVKEMAQSLPFVKSEAEQEQSQNDFILEGRVVELQAEIHEKEAEVNQLQQQLDTSANENEALLLEQERLLAEIEELKRAQDSTKQKQSEVVKTFEQMSAKSAAPVIVKMSDAEALQILTSLKPDRLAAILEKMSPDDAAKYMSMMTN